MWSLSYLAGLVLHLFIVFGGFVFWLVVCRLRCNQLFSAHEKKKLTLYALFLSLFFVLVNMLILVVSSFQGIRIEFIVRVLD